jgi:hypothetical protein
MTRPEDARFLESINHSLSDCHFLKLTSARSWQGLRIKLTLAFLRIQRVDEPYSHCSARFGAVHAG